MLLGGLWKYFLAFAKAVIKHVARLNKAPASGTAFDESISAAASAPVALQSAKKHNINQKIKLDDYTTIQADVSKPEFVDLDVRLVANEHIANPASQRHVIAIAIAAIDDADANASPSVVHSASENISADQKTAGHASDSRIAFADEEIVFEAKPTANKSPSRRQTVEEKHNALNDTEAMESPSVIGVIAKEIPFQQSVEAHTSESTKNVIDSQAEVEANGQAVTDEAAGYEIDVLLTSESDTEANCFSTSPSCVDEKQHLEHNAFADSGETRPTGGEIQIRGDGQFQVLFENVETAKIHYTAEMDKLAYLNVPDSTEGVFDSTAHIDRSAEFNESLTQSGIVAICADLDNDADLNKSPAVEAVLNKPAVAQNELNISHPESHPVAATDEAIASTDSDANTPQSHIAEASNEAATNTDAVVNASESHPANVSGEAIITPDSVVNIPESHRVQQKMDVVSAEDAPLNNSPVLPTVAAQSMEAKTFADEKAIPANELCFDNDIGEEIRANGEASSGKVANAGCQIYSDDYMCATESPDGTVNVDTPIKHKSNSQMQSDNSGDVIVTEKTSIVSRARVSSGTFYWMSDFAARCFAKSKATLSFADGGGEEPSEWIYPIQTGNCLLITQVYKATKENQKIILE